jgi:cold shock protein
VPRLRFAAFDNIEQGARDMTGTIKTTVRDRGFGFISGQAGDNYFFHRADLADGTEFADLREGDEVSFEEFSPRPEKGPRAINVQQVEHVPAGVPEPEVA